MLANGPIIFVVFCTSVVMDVFFHFNSFQGCFVGGLLKRLSSVGSSFLEATRADWSGNPNSWGPAKPVPALLTVEDPFILLLSFHT